MKIDIISLLLELKNPRKFLYSRIKKPVRVFLSSMFDRYKQKTTEKVVTLREILFKAGVVALTTSVVVWLSVFLYVAFYYSYMPNVTHSRPVHFNFKSCDEQKGICSFPSSHVQLTRRQNLLMVGQPYKISLLIDMPESEVNKKLGMFLCCTELRAKGGALVSHSCRHGILPYRSQILSFMFTLAYAPLLLTGWKEERRTLTLEMFPHFEEDQNSPVTDVFIEVQSRHIELYSATLHIDAHFSGLRYIMFHWPMFSAVVGISSNLMFVALVCALSWYHLQSNFGDNKDDEDDEVERESGDLKGEDMFSGEPEAYLFDPRDLEDVEVKKEKKEEDSQASDITSFEESLGPMDDTETLPTKSKLELESTE